jgi:hypothetical protein
MTGLDFRELAGALKEGNLDAVTEMAQKANDAAKAAAGAATGTTTAPADTPASGPATTEPPATPIGDTPGVGIPDVNKTLVAPHKDAMKKWFVYGMFGL